MDEISNGTSHYRSLHNLTEQVEHQYHGRYLIELIQNAHDALFDEVSISDTPQRIEIILEENEPPYGALYIANDGQPFTKSNFNALSNLGQSDKDPQKSIGNKGIGFRSVLEITKEPEIYSRKVKASESFDGYCFAFGPNVIEKFEKLITRFVIGDDSLVSLQAFGQRLLEWDDVRVNTFRDKCRSFNPDWIHEQLAYLSPYALPIPLNSENMRPRVANFEQRGFSTVIRLPLLNDNVKKDVTEKLEEINESTTIFLNRVNVLRLSTNSSDNFYKREQKPLVDDLEGGFEVLIEASGTNAQRSHDDISKYWLWKRMLGGDDRPNERDKIKSAVIGMPGKWPELDEATVEIAVKVDNEPCKGMLNIYLPTKVQSGCAAHFSAPFYGDMSRTDIDFKNSLNSYFLRNIAEKGVDIIIKSLSGKGASEVAAIIDILAPTNCDAGQRWWNTLEEVFSDREIDIKNQDIALSDKGWGSFACTRLLPDHKSNVVINSSLLRSEATYPVFIQTLQKRENRIRRIFEKIHIQPEAPEEDKATTIEAIAQKLHASKKQVNWNGFWKDVQAQFESTEPLKGKQILLGTDNQLHSCGNRCSVFFRPRRDVQDSEISSNSRIEDIPEELRSFIAFLHIDIKTHTPSEKGGIKTTATHSYLSNGLVETYGIERIFSSVLVKSTPKLPHDIDDPKSKLCQAILEWGLKLLQASKHDMNESIRLLGRLPAPCLGGWYPIHKTSFGPGWLGKRGEDLKDYLRRLATPECHKALNRLLLPPDHPLWGSVGLSSIDVLEKAGVFNGIRLMSLEGKEWNAKFNMRQRTGFSLPKKGPKVYSSELWKAYRGHIKNTERLDHVSQFDYEVRDIYFLPGLEKIGGLDDKTHKLLMDLLLISIASWKNHWRNWEKIEIRKINGAVRTYTPVSPLTYLLRNSKWMQGEIDGETIRFRPSDRWYIPSPALVGGLHQFSHLMPIPNYVAFNFIENQELVESMKNLGMPIYSPDEDTNDPRLLNDLAVSLEKRKDVISNQSVFLGQIRTAWRQFMPGEGDAFPDKIIIERGNKNFKVQTPKENQFVYLPDAKPALCKGLKLYSMPLIVIERKDANRLKELFQNAYGNGVRLSSDLVTRALVDGHEWQAQDEKLSLSEALPKLIPIVLSIFAFSGSQIQAADTKTFAKAMEALRNTWIVWVDTLEVGIWSEEDLIARDYVPAFWLSDQNTLLAINETRTELSKLSEELESIVGRNDISTGLKLVLKPLENNDQITEDIVCESLSEINITEDQYQEVKQLWFGDFYSKIILIRPLILLIQPEADLTLLDQVSTEEQFQDALKLYNIDQPDLDRILSIVGDASRLKSVGYKAWKTFGDRAQLSQWNMILSRLEEQLVINNEANEQFTRHRDSCSAMMHSVIRYIICKQSKSLGFKEMEGEYMNLECPDEYIKNYWEVSFHQAMKEVCGLLMGWGTDLRLVSLVERVASAEELHSELVQFGLDPNLDSIEIQAENLKIFSNVLEQVQKCALVWCIKKKSDAGMWEKDKDTFINYLKDDFSKSVFIDIWNEELCLQLIGKLNRSQIHEGFWFALDKSSTLDMLKDRLEITHADLVQVRDRFKAHKQELELQKKIETVCGVGFVNSEENYGHLWDHIVSAIKDDDMPIADLSNIEKLEDQESFKKRIISGKTHNNQKKSKGSISQGMKNLIGVVGEIHAFRALQKHYGIEIVRPGDWVSDNSRHKYPGNTTNDGFGCDIKIQKEGRTYYIEVKATQEDSNIFDLGPSQIKLAIDCANRRKVEFMILHVLYALSASPKFLFLPNPYSKKYRNQYQFEESGMRVRYKKRISDIT